jgi:hypothetical protein
VKSPPSLDAPRPHAGALRVTIGVMRALALLLAPVLLVACGGAARVDLEPRTLLLSGRGQAASIQATPRERSGRPVPSERCRWSSTDPSVAKVEGEANAARVVSVGPGTATVRCTIGSLTAEVPVTVRVVARLSVRPERAEVRMLDDPAPLALHVEAVDDQGAPVTGRLVNVTCAREDVCRGDSRGQLWGTGAGETTARVEVEGAQATLTVKVVDARTAAGKPRAVKGDPMEEIERAVRAREAEERTRH